ncbi:hypothetical protein [Microcoleus sp. D3_18_C4]|uniref:hypothetical protein n=1 Tax=Microcoleus sp. D3_18_C4 TaxID=3055335 RepID=UPI002FD78C59
MSDLTRLTHIFAIAQISTRQASVHKIEMHPWYLVFGNLSRLIKIANTLTSSLSPQYLSVKSLKFITPSVA